MSGTSLDGADAAIVEFLPGSQRTLAFASIPFPAALRTRLLALSDARGDTLDAAGESSIALADCYAEAFHAALEGASIGRDQVVESVSARGPHREPQVQLGARLDRDTPGYAAHAASPGFGGLTAPRRGSRTRAP